MSPLQTWGPPIPVFEGPAMENQKTCLETTHSWLVSSERNKGPTRQKGPPSLQTLGISRWKGTPDSSPDSEGHTGWPLGSLLARALGSLPALRQV